MVGGDSLPPALRAGAPYAALAPLGGAPVQSFHSVRVTGGAGCLTPPCGLHSFPLAANVNEVQRLKKKRKAYCRFIVQYLKGNVRAQAFHLKQCSVLRLNNNGCNSQLLFLYCAARVGSSDRATLLGAAKPSCASWSTHSSMLL